VQVVGQRRRRLLARRDPVVWQEEALFTSCAVNEASGCNAEARDAPATSVAGIG